MIAEITMIKRKTTVEEGNILKEIKRNMTREKEVVQALKKEDSLTWEENGVVYMEERIYVPNNKKIKEKILRENHNLADIEHSGQHRMLELLKNKVQHQKKVGELHPLEILKGPWQEISINIIGPLPKSNGMDTIVIIVDRFTKMIRLKVTTMNISLEGIAKIYRDKIWKLHGIPRKILSNRRLQFALKFMEEFTKVLGTKRQLSTAYHPQTDGLMERIN